MGAQREVPLGCVGPAGLWHPGRFGTGTSRPRQRMYRPSGPDDGLGGLTGLGGPKARHILAAVAQAAVLANQNDPDGLGGLKARRILCRWREPPVLGNQDTLRPGGPTGTVRLRRRLNRRVKVPSRRTLPA